MKTRSSFNMVAMRFAVILSLLFLSPLTTSSRLLALPSLLPLKNTATDNASTVIQYPEDRNESGITVFETVTLLAEIANSNKPVVESSSTDFGWDFDWTKPWIGAGSLRLEISPERNRPIFKIMLWGGFVRATGMTKAALEFSLCHEFGHFLAGAPHQVFPDEALHWSSAEGQADWWAARDCLPRLYHARGLTDEESRARILQAGQDFAHFAYLQYEKGSIEASYNTRAPETPATTLTTAYPTTQCRLDTIADAAACAFHRESNVRTIIAATNAMSAMSAMSALPSVSALPLCQRPRCWYNEPQP